ALVRDEDVLRRDPFAGGRFLFYRRRRHACRSEHLRERRGLRGCSGRCRRLRRCQLFLPLLLLRAREKENQKKGLSHRRPIFGLAFGAVKPRASPAFTTSGASTPCENRSLMKSGPRRRSFMAPSDAATRMRAGSGACGGGGSSVEVF